MAGVFVSYRRDDSRGFAGRLADDLDELLGDDRVFRDIEIPAGTDFTDVLHRAIAASDILLVVIGRRWLARSDEGYASRLFEPADWVRTEIEAAFAQGKHVIPVLVDGAAMPATSSLPASIHQLSRQQAAVLSDRHWHDDVDALADNLRALCPNLSEDLPRGEHAETPAEVLRDLGERLFDEVASRRRPKLSPPRMPPTATQSLLMSLGRGLRKLLVSAVLVAVVYVGIRLFGDEAMLSTLDAFEARLQIAWERLQHYLARWQNEWSGAFLNWPATA